MRIATFGAVVAIAGLFAALGLAGQASGSRVPCAARGSTTLARSSQVRAYTYLRPLEDFPETTLFACHFRTGQRELLVDDIESFFYAGPAVHVNGRVIGYAFQTDGEPGVLIRAKRLPSGDAARRWTVRDLKVGSVRVTRGGGLALIQCPVEPEGIPPLPGPECMVPLLDDVVTVIECDGTRRRLDRGRGIDPGSLRLLADDRTLVWLKNHKRRTGRFGVRCGAPELQDPDGAGPLSGVPTIAGEPRVGGRLTAKPGRWTLLSRFGYLYRFDYRWFRCDQAGEGCMRIPLRGGNNFLYFPSAADVGLRLRVEVIARDFGGTATATSALTEPIAPTAPLKPQTVTW